MSVQSNTMNNAAAGHGDDWGMTFPTRSLGKPEGMPSRDWADIAPPYAPWRDQASLDNLSSAADHDRLGPIQPTAFAKKLNWPIEYKSSNLTIYYRANSMVHDHLVTSGDWNV